MFDNLIKAIIIFLDDYSKKLIIAIAVILLIILGLTFNQAKNYIQLSFPEKEEILDNPVYDWVEDDFGWSNDYNHHFNDFQEPKDTPIQSDTQVGISESEELSVKILKKQIIKKGKSLTKKQENLQETIKEKNVENNGSTLLEKQQELQNLWEKQLDTVSIEKPVLDISKQDNKIVQIINKIERVKLKKPKVQDISPVIPVNSVIPVDNNTEIIEGTQVITDWNTTTTIEPDGTTTTTDGNTTVVTEPDGTTTATDGDTTIITEPDGTTTTTDWETTVVTQPDGTTTTSDWDISTTVEPDGTTTTTDGDTTTTTEPDGTTTTTNGTTTTVETEPDTSWDNTNQNEDNSGNETNTQEPEIIDNDPIIVTPVVETPVIVEPVIEPEIADEDVVTITTQEIQPEVLNWYFNNYVTINIWNGVQKAIKIATQSQKTPNYPTNPSCPNRYSPIATYSNIGLNQHLFSRSKEELPYEDTEKWVSIDLTDEFSVTEEWIIYDYKVFNVNDVKIWGITYKTKNPNVDYHWIIKVCLRD